MAIPAQSVSGSEVLRRECIESQSNSQTAFRFDTQHPTTGNTTYTVPANHIITMLSIFICEQGNVAETFTMWVVSNSNEMKLLQGQSLGARETFVWNDRFTLIGGDALHIGTGNAANVDVYYSYIDQSWV